MLAVIFVPTAFCSEPRPFVYLLLLSFSSTEQEKTDITSTHMAETANRHDASFYIFMKQHQRGLIQSADPTILPSC